ncbi:allophanate hydrolase [Verrucomicrobiales bacterium]|nr:allophanate hydrolase [Verrucomicrobiales bacterium]
MISTQSIRKLRSDYADGSLTVDILLDHVVAQADACDPAIWIHRLSREELQAYAERLSGREGLPLYGVPFAIKDNIDLEGVPTTAGCPEFAYTPIKSATVVAKLIEAGAIPIGKTNLDQFATGLAGVRSPYGIPGNAIDPNNVPGGSSSGSAVAVAKGLVTFSLGTDTAGSGRVPAALNKLVGLKPTCGRLSTHGVVPACRTLDCVSIFAQTNADAYEVLRAAEGFDHKDPYSRRLPISLPPVPKSPRVATPRPTDLEFFGNTASEQAFAEACEKMVSLGWTLTEVDFRPFLEVARLLYEGPWVAERYAAIRAFIEGKPHALHRVTREIIGEGDQILAVDAFESFYQLQARRRELEPFWESFDMLVTPTVGTTYSIAEVEADPIQLNSNLGYYTNFVNLLDMAAVAVPASVVDNGNPFGITLSAPAFHDLQLLCLADQIHGIQPSAIPDRLDHCLLAVCGTHLQGLPLHHQLTDLGATFVERTTTSPHYRLYALPNTTPPKPGLLRDETGAGESIEIEIYALTKEAFGHFVSQIPSPLGIGRIETASGDSVSGFLCEPFAIRAAKELTKLRSWRNYR